jgi:putative endonuclease
LKVAYIYIMASTTRTTYIGVTNDLQRRVWEHKTHFYPNAFTSQYNITKLVFIEEYERFDDAIAREKSLKAKTREKKIALIEAANPRWNDLAWNWFDETDLMAARARHQKERAARVTGCASHGDSSAAASE